MAVIDGAHALASANRAIVPLHTFPTQDAFVSRHEQGTLIEMQNEAEILKQLNERRFLYSAWPIAPILELTTSFVNTWLFLVEIPRADTATFPSVSDRFTIDMESRIDLAQGKFSLVQLHAARISNPYEDLVGLEETQLQKYAAFRVDVPRSWRGEHDTVLEMDLMTSFQIAKTIHSLREIHLSGDNCQKFTIHWDTSAITFEAELAALRSFTEAKRLPGRGPSPKARIVFQMIQNFSASWKTFYSLHDEFPHLKDPTHRFHRLSPALVQKFINFTPDHRDAFYGLSRIPNGLYFVNGCPGAGKTEWNMVVSALIQSKRRIRSKRRHSPILFLVDINQAVDDAADRYFNLCKEVNLALRIIRMHGWPYEMRHSDTINRTGKSQEQPKDEEGLDFTKRFLTTAGLSRFDSTRPRCNKAPTLDEASWEYYQLHKDEVFSSLDKLLQRMEKGDVLGTNEWKALRSLVAMLYRAVLAQTDFVATTPAAASGSFSKLFRPEVVFVDEAPHARELTTLIPIAYYDPVAWIFTGDVKQTRPFVKTGSKQEARREGLTWNPYAEQLRISTMARAEAVNAVNSSLVINKRAYGNLERLPSELFYQGKMVSGHDEAARWPASTRHLRDCLSKFGAPATMNETRIIISPKDGCEEPHNKSFWNPAHYSWILTAVQVLLQDDAFRALNGSAGSIMIETPYRAAYRQYQSAVRRWPEDWQDRVSVLTVDKAQGNQADVVFLDMVRTTQAGFMDDAQRLNVAITRARQAEVIIMHPRMTWRTVKGVNIRSTYTSQVWDDTEKDGRLIVL